MISNNDDLIKKILEMREMFSDLNQSENTHFHLWLRQLDPQSKQESEFLKILTEFRNELEKVLYPEGSPVPDLVTEKDVTEPVAKGHPIFEETQIGTTKYYVLPEVMDKNNKDNKDVKDKNESAQNVRPRISYMQDYRLAIQKLIKRSLTYKDPDIRPHDAIPGDSSRIRAFLNKKEHEAIAKYLRDNIKKLEPINVAFLKFREDLRSPPQPSSEEIEARKTQAGIDLETERLRLRISEATRQFEETKADDEISELDLDEDYEIINEFDLEEDDALVNLNLNDTNVNQEEFDSSDSDEENEEVRNYEEGNGSSSESDDSGSESDEENEENTKNKKKAKKKSKHPKSKL